MSNKAGIKKAWPFVLLGTCATLLVAGAVALIIVLSNPKGRSDKMIEKAENKLLEESYKLVLTTVADSTNESIKSTLKNTDPIKITLILDGEHFVLDEPIGDASVTYCYYDGRIYIDESVTNTYTQSKMSAEELARFRGEYIDPNIIKYKADDYTKSKIKKDQDGNKVVTLTMLTDEKTAEIEAGLKPESISELTAEMSIDHKETKTVIVFDSEGRYKSIKQVYGIRMDFGDYKALVTLTAEKEYSYGDSAKLGEPEGFVDLSGEYKDIFGMSFKVTTDVSSSTSNAEILDRLYSIDGLLGSLRDSVLLIDGNNIKCEYPNTAEGEEEADGISETWTLVGDTLYLDYTQTFGGETSNEKLKQEPLAGGNRTSLFRDHVKTNIFPAFARDYTDITVTEDQNGIITVTCTGFTEAIYTAVARVMNATTGQSGSNLGIAINNDKCTYVVRYDENGRFLSTCITVDVTPVDITTDQASKSEYIKIERTFDYSEAENYYNSVGEAYQDSTWIKAPENASEYSSNVIYYESGNQ